MDNYLGGEYLAGLIDGKGTIGIYPSKKNDIVNYSLRISFEVTGNSYIPSICKSQFGGSVQKINPISRRRRTRYVYTVASSQAYKLLYIIMPFIRVKRKEVDLAMEFGKMKEGRKNKPLSSDEMDKRSAIISAMHELHRR